MNLTHEPPGGTGNTRNGSTPTKLITETGEVQIDTPGAGRESAPQIVRRRRCRFQGYDHKILALYARGISDPGCPAHLQEIDGVNSGHDLISE